MKSIISNARECFICGATSNLHTHHCLHGYHRRFADENGLTVPLCWICHSKVHGGRSDLDSQLKRIAQAAYETAHTREEWMNNTGRNYL